ncbi:hypothetical protein T07_7321 [Trichinella nelsoni]|uniref:Uncharacterized protein n=1 Tax=Trichinella nelsoni TaxID=6336 RepID=A0A0V0RCP4_9BILA|nr:hypothetical protein T07_7321 [Trichinella nelsoni]
MALNVVFCQNDCLQIVKIFTYKLCRTKGAPLGK